MIQFDSCFSNGLKPPARYILPSLKRSNTESRAFEKESLLKRVQHILPGLFQRVITLLSKLLPNFKHLKIEENISKQWQQLQRKEGKKNI